MDELTETILAHPTYIYCTVWIELYNKLLLITGGYDGILRCWSTSQVQYNIVLYYI